MKGISEYSKSPPPPFSKRGDSPLLFTNDLKFPRISSKFGSIRSSFPALYPLPSTLYPVVLLPTLTSLLLILSYPKFNQGWLAWFALAPLTVAVWKAKDLKTALLGGLAAGFFFYLGILYWIYPTMRAGGVNVPVSLAGWAALSLTLSVEFLVVSVFGFYLKKPGRAVWPYMFAAGWTLMEWLKILVTLKGVWFPWFMLGYTQWGSPKIIQIVSVTGTYGLSFAVALSGALLGCALMRKGGIWKKAYGLLPALILIGGLFAFGTAGLKKAGGAKLKGQAAFSMLQPSIELYQKWDERYARGIEERIERLLERAGASKIIVWPENALPGWIDEPQCRDWLKKVSAGTGTFNIVGSVSQGDGKHVAAFLLDEKGSVAASYYKRRLVPFGEYVPLRELLGRYLSVVSELGEFEKGTLNQKLFEADGVKMGIGICYESVFPYLARSDVSKGADLLVNVTNDGWYLDTAAPYQHFLANIFRAAENRKSLVRAANNGISALIDPWGRISAKTALNDYTILNVNAPLYENPGKTFYVEHGDWFCWLCLLLAGAFLLALVFI
ncbi:MAG: apolipoprotein N-acyltransferase [Elusimicrobia bacterium]|nr:apolipoprotein N-acyltransferase [Elusimicrobiota bacterium]